MPTPSGHSLISGSSSQFHSQGNVPPFNKLEANVRPLPYAGANKDTLGATTNVQFDPDTNSAWLSSSIDVGSPDSSDRSSQQKMSKSNMLYFSSERTVIVIVCLVAMSTLIVFVFLTIVTLLRRRLGMMESVTRENEVCEQTDFGERSFIHSHTKSLSPTLTQHVDLPTPNSSTPIITGFHTLNGAHPHPATLRNKYDRVTHNAYTPLCSLGMGPLNLEQILPETHRSTEATSQVRGKYPNTVLLSAVSASGGTLRTGRSPTRWWVQPPATGYVTYTCQSRNSDGALNMEPTFKCPTDGIQLAISDDTPQSADSEVNSGKEKDTETQKCNNSRRDDASENKMKCVKATEFACGSQCCQDMIETYGVKPAPDILKLRVPVHAETNAIDPLTDLQSFRGYKTRR
ncbi:unnamed protein product [Dicrocoelium dendriticum]|nr:unnamed protein product [Dicrocoelium dendriticum]